jgi:transposase
MPTYDGGGENVTMGEVRRRFTLEFTTEAAHWVLDSGRSVSEVAREFSLAEDSLYLWVRDERRRIPSVKVR